MTRRTIPVRVGSGCYMIAVSTHSVNEYRADAGKLTVTAHGFDAVCDHHFI